MLEYINSISTAIMSKFKNSPIYIEGEPRDFERPSFYITFIAGDNDELNRRMYMENMTFQIVYFGVLNEFNKPDVERQLEDFSTLKKLFNRGYLELVGKDKRVAKITGTSFDKRDNEVYIDLTLQLSKIKDEDGLRYDEGDYELMKDINIALQ